MIEARGLTLHYGSRCAYRDVDFVAPEGSVTAIVGPSGCGKTSFLHTLARLTDLVPGVRVEGRLRVGEQDVLDARCDLSRLRRNVGTIFQKPAPFPVSVRRNFTLPLREHGVKSKAEQQRLMVQVLKDVGLWDEVKDRLDEPALRLSGGQKQRLCIARALVLSPRVLLMDEPCSALDPVSTGRIEALMNKLRGRYTIVIVTHNLAQARRVADFTSVFWVEGDAGVLVESGETRALFEAPRSSVTRAYLSGEEG